MNRGASFAFLRRLLLCVVVTSPALADAQAPWQLESESRRTELGNGCWQVRKKTRGPAALDLSLVFIDMKQTQAVLVAQPTRDKSQAKTLEELAAASGALAGCNGGYFEPDFGPSGLEIAQGVRAGKWRKDLPFGGVLLARRGVLDLMSDADFTEDAGITDLVQCCPLLVARGRALGGIGGADLVRRTFIATDGEGRWLMGFCPRAALEVLAEALVSHEIVPEFRVRTAMNLDGGPSSGLWWKPQPGADKSNRPYVRVRNVLLVLPR